MNDTNQEWPKKTELIKLLETPADIWVLLNLADSSPPNQLVTMAFKDLFEAIARNRARNKGGGHGSN